MHVLIGIQVVIPLGAGKGKIRFLNSRGNEKGFSRFVGTADGRDRLVGNLPISKRIVRQNGVLPREKPVLHFTTILCAMTVFGKMIIRSLLGEMRLRQSRISRAVMHLVQRSGVVAQVSEVFRDGLVLLAEHRVEPWRVRVIDTS